MRLATGLCLLPLIACSKKDDTALAPAASALASSQAAPSASAWHFTIDPKSTSKVDMPGLKEHIMGDTSAAAGTLDIVPGDLSQSRGTVKIDLTTFTTHTFGDAEKDGTQTKHARTWLEAVVDDQTNEAMRWATFAIRSVDGLSATDLSKVAALKDGADDVRTVTMTVHGDMLVHGHQVEKGEAVDVTFRTPTGSPPSTTPTRVTVKSKAPLRLVLKELDIAPRDTAGKLASWTTSLVAKVADYADVTFDLGATPAP